MSTKLIDPVKLLKSLHSIQDKFIQENITYDELFDELLAVLLDLTESQYGFIGRVLKDETQRYLKTYAITDISWNEETAKFYKENAPEGLEFRNLDTLFGWVLKKETTLITNDAPNHPEAAGIPHGHPPLDKFMGVALKFNKQMIGMVGIANRKDGYSKELLNELEAYFSTCATLIKNKIVSEENEVIERKLKRFKIAMDESALVSIADVNGKITYVNEKFQNVSGYTKEELLGKDHRIVNSGFHTREFFAEMWQTLASGNIWKGIIRNKSKNGNYYWVSSVLVPFFDKEGKNSEYLAIRHEITDQKKAEEILEKKNRELDNFATVVSHDLKAPLRGINTMINFIEMDMPTLAPDVKENFEMIKSRVKRLNGFIDGLLEYSRVGKIDVTIENVDFRRVLNEVAEDYTLGNSNVILHVENELPVTRSSYLLLMQVFSNIISNSIKHNDKEEVEITVKAEEKEKYYEIHFIDNGPGIPYELREKVFKIFQTIKTKDEHDSTGVGLSIVKKIAEELGGDAFINETLHNGTDMVLLHPK